MTTRLLPWTARSRHRQRHLQRRPASSWGLWPCAAAGLGAILALPARCVAGCAGEDSTSATTSGDPCAEAPLSGEACANEGAQCRYCETWGVRYDCRAEDGGPPRWQADCCGLSGPYGYEAGAPCGPDPVACDSQMVACLVYHDDCTAEGWRKTWLQNCYECGPAYACPAGDAPPVPGSTCSDPCDPTSPPIWPCEYSLETACGPSTASAWCAPDGWRLSVDCPCDVAADEASCSLNPLCEWTDGGCHG